MKQFMNLPIMTKLLVVFLAVGLIPMTIVALQSLGTSRDIINTQVSNQLSAVKEIKAGEIQRYFQRVRNQVKTLSSDPAVVKAAVALPGAYNNYISELGLNARDLETRKQSVIGYYNDAFGRQYQEINQQSADTAAMYADLDQTSWALQYSYISNNPHPLGEKDSLKSAEDGTEYSRLHAEIHPILRNFLINFGYYDIFIADAKAVTSSIPFSRNWITLHR